jgi:serine/threonine-protein kinase
MKPGPAKSCPSCGERYDTDVLFCPRDGTPLAIARSPTPGNAERDAYLGMELPGQIRLEHLIGIGSMGRVYRAFQGGIERDVAVKVLHRELSGNAELVGRFHREAKVASRLVHPNVVQVLMTGALPATADVHVGGELYLVMEYLDGISLLSALAAAGTSGEGAALPLPRALHVALQICDAVGEAHAQGIVHRDLKPENVMLVRRGDDPDYVKVLDFGIARLEWADRGMATQAGLIFGTAKYISPEGAEGQPVGPQADVYSIATMLYQMLAGRTPFEGDSPVALLVQHTHAPPPPLRTIARASYVPEPLAAAIMTNLSKKPGDRAPNARLLGRDLIAAARASGLYPEEIATQSTLLSPASMGSVKLVSRERTKAHELSAELAAKIGGVAAPPPSSPGGTLIGDGGPSMGRRPAEPGSAPYPGRSGAVPTLPSAVQREHPAAAADAAPPSERPHAAVPPPLPTPMPPPPGSSQRSSAVPPARVAATQLDFDAVDAPAGGPSGTLPGAPASGALTTMQGTETTLGEPAPRRARMARIAAILACALVAAPIAIVGGRRLGGSATASESVEAAMDEARDAMRRRAWDAPPGHNFKELTDAARARWPTDTRVTDLRHQAAVALVNDALDRKYANDVPEATHLVKLALYFNPDLTTAQHLAADLEAASAPDVAPAGSASGGPSDRGSKGRRGRDGKQADAKDPHAPPPPKGSAQPAPVAPPPPPTGAVLPPPPAPHPPDHPPPASTAPWL